MTEKAEENQLVVIAKENGLEESKVTVLMSKFGEPFTSALNVISQARDINVTSEDQKDEIEQASIARKELKKIRCEVENTRKELKEQSLREGRAIDGMANIIKAIIVPVEEELEKQEKFAERLAAERFAKKLEERRERLSKYTDQPDMYKLDSTDEEFERLMDSLKEAQEIKLAAEKKAEEDRVAAEKAAAAEQESIRKENEKLKADAAIREAEIAKQHEVEQKRLAAERKEQEEKLAAERAKAEEERKKREALEAEQLAKSKAEAATKAEAEEKARQALLAPDKDKLNKFADLIDAIEMPNVSNRDAGKVLDETRDYLNRITKNIRSKAKTL